MNTQSVLNHWKEVRKGLNDALDCVQDEQLDFVPGPGLWSLRKLVCHIASVEEMWFRYDVMHVLSDWRLGEYKPEDYPTVASLKKLLAEVHQRTEDYFSKISEEEMAQAVITEKEITTVAWVFLHVFEHEIHHRGEIFLMLGMMGIKAPDV